MHYLIKKSLFALCLPLLFPNLCCTQKPNTDVSYQTPPEIPYDLQNPVLKSSFASEELKEISALSPTDTPGIYLTIADERGVFYFVDTSGKMVNRVYFRDRGDFEGAEMVGKSLWALKSNGKLYLVENWEKDSIVEKDFKTFLSKEDDVEGLGYDAKRNALLLACKGDPDSSYLRNIYAFDLDSLQLLEKPAYSIDPLEVNKLVQYGETEKHDYFSPSAVAINPLSGDVYVISAALKRLVVLDGKDGHIRAAARIDKKLLPQPEGISFDKMGNMLISSEGKMGQGRLLMFKLRS